MVSVRPAAGRALLPVHNVGDDAGQETEQHDGRAGVHHGVQDVPWVLGQGEDSLQILGRTQSRRVSRNQAPGGAACTPPSACPLQTIKDVCVGGRGPTSWECTCLRAPDPQAMSVRTEPPREAATQGRWPSPTSQPQAPDIVLCRVSQENSGPRPGSQLQSRGKSRCWGGVGRP